MNFSAQTQITVFNDVFTIPIQLKDSGVINKKEKQETSMKTQLVISVAFEKQSMRAETMRLKKEVFVSTVPPGVCQRSAV